MEVWREPVRGVYGDLAVLAMPGIERFRRGFAGELAPPPIHHLTGMHPTEATQGRCVFAMPATDRLRTSLGTIPLGALAFLADAALGGVVNTGLGPGSVASTSELALHAVRPATTSAGSFVVRFLRPGPLEGELVADATVIHSGRTMVVTQARLTTPDGAVVALADGSSAVVPLDVRALPLEEATADRVEVDPGPGLTVPAT